MTYRQILYGVDEGIATITLNRPETLNAMTPTLQEECADALRRADRDPEVKVILITGAGRAFCAGANPRDLARRLEKGEVSNPSVHDLVRALWSCGKPTLAAVNGPAVGGGMDLASLCDIRLASDRARFSMGYVRMGMIPAQGGLWILPRLIGLANALDLIWTGRTLDAQEAYRLGYVQAVYPAEEFRERVREYALRLARGPTVAIHTAKRLAHRLLSVDDLETALRLTDEAVERVQRTEDALEGPRAWLERREPQFKGR